MRCVRISKLSFDSTETWLRALERLYAVFRVAPFGPPRIKAIKKSQKLYFWDWSRVEGGCASRESGDAAPAAARALDG